MHDRLVLLTVAIVLVALLSGSLTGDAVTGNAALSRFAGRQASYTGQRGGYVPFTPFPLKVITPLCGISCCQGSGCIKSEIVSNLYRAPLAGEGERRKEKFVPTGEFAYRGRIRVFHPKQSTLNLCFLTHQPKATLPVLLHKTLFFQEGTVDDTCTFRDGKVLPAIKRWTAE